MYEHRKAVSQTQAPAEGEGGEARRRSSRRPCSPGKRFMGSLALAIAPGPLPVPRSCPPPGTAVEEEAVMWGHHYFFFLLKELVQDKWAVPSPAAA